MLFTKLLVSASLFGIIFTIKCYSGMQGSIDNHPIERIELLDCNATDFCVKLPSNGHVGRKHYEGAQYSCDFGECRKEGCNRREGGGTLCCCSTDECNVSSVPYLYIITILVSLAIYLKI